VSLLKLFSNTKTQQSENENTIKEFFFYHHGDGMSMDRDDPQKYKQYRTLSEATIELWRQDLITQDFELLAKDATDSKWITIGNLIRLISSSKNNIEENFKKLLTQIIEFSPSLDKRQKILILEHFAGRTLSQKDGGIYLIQSKTNLKELLKTSIDELSKFTCNEFDNISEIGWGNIQQRYNCAKKSVQSAFQKFNID